MTLNVTWSEFTLITEAQRKNLSLYGMNEQAWVEAIREIVGDEVTNQMLAYPGNIKVKAHYDIDSFQRLEDNDSEEGRSLVSVANRR